MGLINGIPCDESDSYQYLGIPYVEPPVGSLRWKRPRPFNGSFPPQGFNASAYGPSCSQTNPFASDVENCLFINVFVPKIASGANPVLPVRVFIHGGAFYSFSADYDPTTDGCMASMIDGAILVNMNYRLNIMGYFALPELQEEDEEHSVGNYGLQDIREALLWVQKYIQYFGGNASQVVLHGGSAGAAAVYYAMVSPKMSGLFSAAWAGSGAGDIFFRTLKDAVTGSEELVVLANCSYEAAAAQGYDSRLACMRNRTSVELLEVLPDTDAYQYHFVPVRIKPVIDGVELTDHPLAMIDAGIFNRVPFVVGNTENDGSMAVGSVEDMGNNETRFDNYVEAIFGSMAEFIKRQYGPEEYTSVMGEAAVDRALEVLITNFYYKCQRNKIGSVFARAGHPVYLYEWCATRYNDSNVPTYGVYHGVEGAYLFQWIGTSLYVGDEADFVLQRVVSSTLTNLGRLGAMGLAEWQPFTTERQEVYFWYKDNRTAMYQQDFRQACLVLDLWEREFWALRDVHNENATQGTGDPSSLTGPFNEVLFAGSHGRPLASPCPLLAAVFLVLALLAPRVAIRSA